MASKIVYEFGVAVGAPFNSLAGWTETFYRNVSETLIQALEVASQNDEVGQDGGGMLYRRRKMLTAGWRVSAVKVYSTAGNRLSQVFAVPSTRGRGLFTAGGATENEQPYDRLLYRMNTATGRGRSARLGGIPLRIVDPGGNYVSGTAGQWDNYFNSWQTVLVNKSIAVRNTTAGTRRVISDVVFTDTDVPAASNRTPLIITPGNNSAQFQPNTTVRVSGATGSLGVNGQWTVQSSVVVGGVTKTLLFAKRKVRVAGEYTDGGTIVDVVVSFVNIAGLVPVRGVSRKPGRPFGLPRGRRSNRLSI